MFGRGMNEERKMRAIDRPCGHQPEDDDGLVAAAREHIEGHHPEMERSDQQLPIRGAADACDAVGVES